jgi:uncharacterized membrane protein YeaQ/YmgE (transglycosylase-associated protein family)
VQRGIHRVRHPMTALEPGRTEQPTENFGFYLVRDSGDGHAVVVHWLRLLDCVPDTAELIATIPHRLGRLLRQTVVVFGALLSVAFSGLVIGALARLALPGPDPMPFGLTILLGLAGSVIGGGIAAALLGAKHVFDTSSHAFVTLSMEIAAAVAILGLYRRLVQGRPLSGPGARLFPTRGFGIKRMRARLMQLGVDPDRLSGRPGDRSSDQSDLSAAGQAAELERLRDLRGKGAITDEEYEQARDRLRRY